MRQPGKTCIKLISDETLQLAAMQKGSQWGAVLSRYSLTDWALGKWKLSGQDRGEQPYSGVRQQLEILGDEHVAYSGRQFQAASGAKCSIVGGRPFSKVPFLPKEVERLRGVFWVESIIVNQSNFMLLYSRTLQTT
jgi:hypothetical protein